MDSAKENALNLLEPRKNKSCKKIDLLQYDFTLTAQQITTTTGHEILILKKP
jgi:hypothetical protein